MAAKKNGGAITFKMCGKNSILYDKLISETARLDRPAAWIIREALKRYFLQVENEIEIIESKIKRK